MPTFNEERNITFLIAEIKKYLANFTKEILVIDDNSSDKTVENVEREFKSDPEIKVIIRQQNRGLANSIREGIEKAKGEIIVVMDTDFNHQPKYLPFMIQAMDFYDCVTASRFLYGGKMSSRLRHILSYLFNIFVRILTGGYITDNLYGFFAIKRKLLAQQNLNSIFWGYGDYFIRLLYYLQKSNVQILQFPAVNGERKSGTGNSTFFKTFCQYFIATIKLAIWH